MLQQLGNTSSQSDAFDASIQASVAAAIGVPVSAVSVISVTASGPDMLVVAVEVALTIGLTKDQAYARLEVGVPVVAP